ncbi:PepSY-associated TM helix domain-containing protein [Tellurirhabdus bombi]|uniref:PepSY-associated TM helix domain-containing protein n=1 Tax=Tellurirhabdus bombi TaxID=2907205 RepID=UPI001F169764|nr:PepSY-associated TM helix domain-containing protein [Tellurirhabdus bombi]
MEPTPFSKRKNWASHQKKWYGKWHVWLGLLAGTVIFIVSLTGTILVFRDEIDHDLNAKLYEVAAPKQAAKLSFQQIAEQLKRDHPTWELAFLFKPEGESDENLAYHLRLKDYEKEIFVNPYTGQVTGTRLHDSYFIGIVLEIHRSLLIPVVGQYIVGTCSLILVILIISGLRLWIPKQWKHLKSRLTFRKNASFARQTYDLHQVLGFYFSPFILLIALTGAVITFLAILAPVMYLVSFEKPKSLDQILNSKSVYRQGAKPLPLDSAVATALRALPADTNIEGVGFPLEQTGIYAVYSSSPHVTQTGDKNFIYIDQYSGKINFNSAKDLPNTGKMYLNWVEPFHYGTFGGNITRALAFVASLIPSVLFVTGILIWLPRWRGKKKKTRPAASQSESQKIK